MSGFSPTGDRIAVCGQSDARVVRVVDWQAMEEVVLKGHDEEICCVAFNRVGSRVVTGSTDHSVRIWDARSGRLVRKLAGSDDVGAPRSGAVMFGPDDRTVVFAGREIRVWDSETGALRRTIPFESRDHQRALAFHPSGRFVAAMRYEGLLVFDVDSGEEIWRYVRKPRYRDRPLDHGSILNPRLAWVDQPIGEFSRDGRWFLAVPRDGKAILVDTSDWREQVVFEQPGGMIAASLSPDGKQVAMAYESGRVLLRPVDVVAFAEARKPRELTKRERQEFGIDRLDDRKP